MHSTEYGRNGNNFGYGISEEISRREWLGCYEASRVIVTAKHMQEELMRIYNLPINKIQIIPNGIMPGKLKRRLDAGRIKEQYGIHPLAPMVLFCGRMSIQKGPRSPGGGHTSYFEGIDRTFVSSSWEKAT